MNKNLKMNQDQQSECGNCNSKEQWVLHNVRHRGIYRRFCTSCVLKLHPGLFCPNCFEVFEGSNLPIYRVMCLKCPSVSHRDCVSKEVISRYVCPSCLNPNHVFFDSNKKSKDDNGDSVMNENHLAIDLYSAKVFLAAAQISAISMNKATSTAKLEAERRVKEAALTRRRAKEALERLNLLSLTEKKKDGKEMKMMEICSSSVVGVEEQKKPKGNSFVASEKPKGNSAVAAAVAAQKRFQSQVSMALTDLKDTHTSGEAPIILDKVGSREKEIPITFYAPNLVQRPPTNYVMGHQQLQNPSTFSHSQNNCNGLFSGAHVVEENHGKLEGFGDSGIVGQLTHEGGFVSKPNEGVLPTGSSKPAS